MAGEVGGGGGVVRGEGGYTHIKMMGMLVINVK